MRGEKPDLPTGRRRTAAIRLSANRSARSVIWAYAAIIGASLLESVSVRAASVTVAVAANFSPTFATLARTFESTGDYAVTIVSGSTGQLYAQILQAAPFDVFLSADSERPRLLVEAGLGEDPFTYAQGRLVLWGLRPSAVAELGMTILATDNFRHVVLANPRLAPYGAAAQQALETLGYWQRLQSRIAYGQNVGQAFAMVATGTAEIGFAAMSQVVEFGVDAAFVTVPTELYEPINQDAVLLTRARDKDTARNLLNFLGSNRAKAVMIDDGYLTPPSR